MFKRILIIFSALIIIQSVLFAQHDYFLPFMHKAAETITVDTDLDEWNFCFPINLNQSSIPAGSRAHAWLPVDNDDCSGWIKMMWDENYLYFAADIRDDVPGVMTGGTDYWRQDGIEIYLANYSVGNVPWQAGAATGYPDKDDGKYAVQLACYYDAQADTFDIYQWNPVQRSIKSESTILKGYIWDNEDGYTLEGKILWDDFKSDKGNVFALHGGEVLPCTWSLFDVDETAGNDFQGYQFSEDTYPPSAGPGRNWQVIEVKKERDYPFYEYSSPYIKRANGEITLDASLYEWNFVFPVDMNQSSIPPDSRAFGWFPLDNIDLSGPLMFMYDDDYLYFAAEVMDDMPGTMTGAADYWREDAAELYMGSYDIGSIGNVPNHSGYMNSGDSLDVQLGFYYDAYEDTVDIYMWYPSEFIGSIKSELTTLKGALWPMEDGYTIEGRLSLQEIADRVDVAGQRTFDFANNVGCIFPATYSLFDVDDIDVYDFDGYQYAAVPPYEGPGNGSWTGVEIVEKCLLEELDWLWENDTGVEEKTNRIPVAFNLSQNYPNPFNPSTSIEFSLVENGSISLNIFNTRGELVKTLMNNEFKSAGSYSVNVDMSDVSSGVYFYVLEQGNLKLTNKMMLLK
ncbi:T9SS type A sorting domain-containing protein [candidate division KSB1 bacterium]|nr:T9SS type A sorting domain-containing protein [candidate division KSB1 bacterium]